MLLKRFEVQGLAQYSYLLASQGSAVVIDPQRDIDEYIRFADETGFRITHVLETHIHADFASGAAALAERSGAELWLSAHDEGEDFQYSFPHHPFRDKEELHIGDLRIVAIHTPGHTPEHLSFLLFEKGRCGQPLALFSGDFIFVGSLGRPDLLGEDAKQRLAGQLFDSVRTKVSSLPDGTMILPGHGAGSLCGAGLAERPESTLGYERHCNIFMAREDKNSFAEKVLGSVPQFPPYYKRMKSLNSKGAPALERLPGSRLLSPSEFEAEVAEKKGIILDLRTPDAFGGAHIPDSFNIGSGPNLSLWSGWVLPYDRPVFLVGDTQTDLREVRKSLIRVGHDTIEAALKGGIESWIAAGKEQAHVPQISVLELDAKVKQGAFVLDVRSPKEWESGHVARALHIPGGDLPNRLNELPSDRIIHIICGSGYRSSIASSLLQRSGYAEVVNTLGGMTAWKAQNLPEERV